MIEMLRWLVQRTSNQEGMICLQRKQLITTDHHEEEVGLKEPNRQTPSVTETQVDEEMSQGKVACIPFHLDPPLTPLLWQTSDNLVHTPLPDLQAQEEKGNDNVDGTRVPSPSNQAIELIATTEFRRSPRVFLDKIRLMASVNLHAQCRHLTAFEYTLAYLWTCHTTPQKQILATSIGGSLGQLLSISCILSSFLYGLKRTFTTT